jgi:hypothetical protein
MRAFVRYTALFLTIVFLAGDGLVWFEVLTHENIFNNPQLKLASGWLATGLMLLALGLKGLGVQRRQPNSTEGPRPGQPPA